MTGVTRQFSSPVPRKVTRTHVRKKSLNRVRVFWLLPVAPVAVECNSLSISRFLIIGCAFLRTLKCVTACVIAVYISRSQDGISGAVCQGTSLTYLIFGLTYVTLN